VDRHASLRQLLCEARERRRECTARLSASRHGVYRSVLRAELEDSARSSALPIVRAQQLASSQGGSRADAAFVEDRSVFERTGVRWLEDTSGRGEVQSSARIRRRLDLDAKQLVVDDWMATARSCQHLRSAGPRRRVEPRTFDQTDPMHYWCEIADAGAERSEARGTFDHGLAPERIEADPCSNTDPVRGIWRSRGRQRLARQPPSRRWRTERR